MALKSAGKELDQRATEVSDFFTKSDNSNSSTCKDLDPRIGHVTLDKASALRAHLALVRWSTTVRHSGLLKDFRGRYQQRRDGGLSASASAKTHVASYELVYL